MLKDGADTSPSCSSPSPGTLSAISTLGLGSPSETFRPEPLASAARSTLTVVVRSLTSATSFFAVQQGGKPGPLPPTVAMCVGAELEASPSPFSPVVPFSRSSSAPATTSRLCVPSSPSCAPLRYLEATRLTSPLLSATAHSRWSSEASTRRTRSKALARLEGDCGLSSREKGPSRVLFLLGRSANEVRSRSGCGSGRSRSGLHRWGGEVGIERRSFQSDWAGLAR